ncbi:MAG TPA: YihY/virulence factor BrkB family protein [Afifellaceae bacterium]|nr:YihY/virulence factor BrkB family protein [Afifellaceae bacterium]
MVSETHDRQEPGESTGPGLLAEAGRFLFTGLREIRAVLWDALDHLNWHDGVLLASGIAFALVFAIFPFLIFLIALGGGIGGQDLANQIAEAALTIMPEHMVRTIEPALDRVIHPPGRGGLLTFGLLVTLVTITSAVEAIRDGLNRAYGCIDNRNFLKKRLGSLVFVLFGMVAIIVLAALAVAAPLTIQSVARDAAATAWYPLLMESGRQVLLILVLLVMIASTHLFLPAHERRVRMIMPGVLLTLVLWWAAGWLFGLYLNRFTDYSAVYAGLGGIMALMFFLWILALIFQFGAELNRAIAERIAKHRRGEGR